MKLGNNIRKIRELKGFSQEYVANKLTLSQTAYSKIERDETDITFKRIEEIAKVLNINPIDIIKFDENVYFNNNTLNDNSVLGFVVNSNPNGLVDCKSCLMLKDQLHIQSKEKEDLLKIIQTLSEKK